MSMLQSPADTDVKILALMSSGQWINLNQIQQGVKGSSLNRERLLKKLEDLKSLNHIHDWNDFPEQEKKEYMKNNPTFSDVGQKHIYKITDRGQKSFQKIRDDCLDEETQKILRLEI